MTRRLRTLDRRRKLDSANRERLPRVLIVAFPFEPENRLHGSCASRFRRVQRAAPHGCSRGPSRLSTAGLAPRTVADCDLFAADERAGHRLRRRARGELRRKRCCSFTLRAGACVASAGRRTATRPELDHASSASRRFSLRLAPSLDRVLQPRRPDRHTRESLQLALLLPARWRAPLWSSRLAGAGGA